MRTNGQPALNASQLRPDHLDLTGRKKIVCRHCRRWSFYKKHMVYPHDDQGVPCPGSGQRVWLDLTPGQWARELAEGLAEVAKIKPPDVSDPTWREVAARI